jgi:hypothetical protein
MKILREKGEILDHKIVTTNEAILALDSLKRRVAQKLVELGDIIVEEPS